MSVPRPVFPPPTLDALGRMFLLHFSLCLSPCSYAFGRVILHLSPFSLHLSPLASDYSGYTWPELSLACLQLKTLLGRGSQDALVHLSLCLSPPLDTLGRMVLHLPSTSLLLHLSHLSPCLSPCCFTCLPSCLPACLTSQNHGGLKASNIFQPNKA